MYLIDAYNLLHQCHLLPGENTIQEAAELAHEINRRIPDQRVWLICDGAPPGNLPEKSQINEVTLRFAGGGRDADSLIEWILDTDHNARQMIVVSDDHRIIRAAKRRKATPMPCQKFIHTMLHGSDAHAPMQGKPDPTPDENQQWLHAFSRPPENTRPDLDLSQFIDRDTPAVQPQNIIEKHITPNSASSEPASVSVNSESSEALADEWLNAFQLDENSLKAIEAEKLPEQLQKHLPPKQPKSRAKHVTAKSNPEKPTQKPVQPPRPEPKNFDEMMEGVQTMDEDHRAHRSKDNPNQAGYNQAWIEAMNQDIHDEETQRENEDESTRWLRQMGINPDHLVDERDL